MKALDQVVSTMTEAAKAQLGKDWQQLSAYATDQFKLLGVTLAGLEQLRSSGAITPEQAKQDLLIAKNTTQMILVTESGLAELTVKKAIDSAFDAILDVVDEVLDIPFL